MRIVQQFSPDPAVDGWGGSMTYGELESASKFIAYSDLNTQCEAEWPCTGRISKEICRQLLQCWLCGRLVLPSRQLLL